MSKKVDFSIIITAWKEPRTVALLVRGIERQLMSLSDSSFEILLVCPDEETWKSGLEEDCLKILRRVKDDGVGKPSALNKAFNVVSGNWLILTDGDVYWGDNVVVKILSSLTDNSSVCLTGRPVSVDSRNSMFGYWAHLLTFMAHKQRLTRSKQKRFLVASGYLLVLKNGLVKKIPPDVLSDDAYISYFVKQKGFWIDYIPKAKVYVKFPDNFRDWVSQKSRSAGGYVQIKRFIAVPKDKMRSFGNELSGLLSVLSYSRNLKEFFWSVLLLFARLYLWFKIFLDRKLIKKSFSKTWVRIESTK